MNNFEDYAELDNDDMYVNGMGEFNIETLNIDDEIQCKSIADVLLANSIKIPRITNDVPDWEETNESHFTSYDSLFSDSDYDFESWDY